MTVASTPNPKPYTLNS